MRENAGTVAADCVPTQPGELVSEPSQRSPMRRRCRLLWVAVPSNVIGRSHFTLAPKPEPESLPVRLP